MYKTTVFTIILSCLFSPVLLAQEAPDTVTITLPDHSQMRFHAVYLGLTGTPDCRFASREIELGSYENTPNYKKQPGRATISGDFLANETVNRIVFIILAKQRYNAVSGIALCNGRTEENRVCYLL